jgi:hypothetical protein
MWKRKRKIAKQPTQSRLEINLAGRRHLAHVPYALPKDLDEVNRLDFQHYIYRQVMKGNFLAPLQGPHNILDGPGGSQDHSAYARKLSVCTRQCTRPPSL